MKILFDARVHLNYFSGISRYIICLLDAFAKLYSTDELIVLLNPTIEKDNSIYKTLEHYENVTFKTVNAGHMGPKNYTKMGRIIKQIMPDVYHYPHLDAPIFTGNVPVVATVHDANSSEDVKKFDDRFGLKSIYFKQSLKLTLKRADHVIFVSDSVKESILTTYNIQPNAKYSRIYNGFEPNFNQLDAVVCENLLAQLNVTPPYILFVGQIREHKNIFRAIEAFNLFQSKHQEYKLVIVGHNYLNLELNDNKTTHFDKVDNTTLKALYSGCSAFLFPSLFEGFGFPILEAFSYGKPVITSNYGATKEVAAGLAQLVNPKKVKAIANGITTAILNPNSKSEDRIAHTRTFSWEDYAQELRKIYEKVISEKR